MNWYRSDIRNQARLENLIEKMEESILTLKPFEIETLDIKEEGTDAVVLASDWHYGAKHDNYWGKYNSGIAKQRVEKLDTAS